MGNETGTARANKALVIVIGVAFGAIFLFGLIWALVWLAAAGVWGLSRIKLWLGVPAALLAVAVFILPWALDPLVFRQQILAADAQEVSVPPIDMTGKRVLFLGGVRYTPWDCSDLCRAMVEYGAAEAVYFGHGRSLDLAFGNGPIDLTNREIHTFPRHIVPGLPSDAPSVRVTPEQIDYVVIEHGSFNSRAAARITPDLPSYGGLYAMDILWVDLLVFEAGDLTAFDPLAQPPLIARFEANRHRYTFPALPYFQVADRTYDHLSPRDEGLVVTYNAREVAAILCGPVDRPEYEQCAQIWP